MLKQVPEIYDSNALNLDSFDPAVLALVVAAAALIGLVLAFAMRSRRRSDYPDPRPQLVGWRKPSLRLVSVTKNLGSAERQSEIHNVIRAGFFKKRIMNFSEYQLFLQLDQLFRNQPMGYRLFPQVPLGGLIDSEDREAFFSVMNKRCDFVIVARNGEPVAVIEFQGLGHFQGNSAMRDEIKRIALKKAGVSTIEVIVGYQWEQVEHEIRKELGLLQQ